MRNNRKGILIYLNEEDHKDFLEIAKLKDTSMTAIIKKYIKKEIYKYKFDTSPFLPF
jgi:hypothetical protein